MPTSPLHDDAFLAFKKHHNLIASAESFNEANTRLRAIDTVLFEVLNWDKRAVDVEKYARAVGFADYVFGSSPNYHLVLEAKREGVVFVLPGMDYGEDPVPFSLIAKECPLAAAAMRQAAGYAASEGARFVAISNGFQWLLGFSFVLHESVEDRLVYVFESVDAIERKFRTFWNCFSPAGISSNWPDIKLSAHRLKPAPPALSTTLADYKIASPEFADNNKLSAALNVVWETLSLVEDDPDFLRSCYVKADPSDDALRFAKELVENRLATDELISVTATSALKSVDLLTQPSPEKPILVLGRVGHGKSTFLRYLRTIDAAETLKRYIQIDINFVDQPSTSDDVTAFIFRSIEEQLRNRYSIDIEENSFVRAVLNSDLNRFRKSPTGVALRNDAKSFAIKELDYIEKIKSDPAIYFGRVFQHLRASQQRPVAIFLDNLDRQAFEIQEKAFLRASAMAREWSALIFVCLRPDTFYKSKESGVLDSVAPRSLLVAPPPAQALLRLRFQYAAKIANGEVGNEALNRRRAAIGKDIALDLPAAAAVLQSCAGKVAKVKRIPNIFEAVSNQDMRRLLKHVQEVLTSDRLDTRATTSATPISDVAALTEQAVLQSMLFKTHRNYDPRHSPFINLFHVAHCDPREHFSRITTLNFLRERNASVDGSEFCVAGDIIHFLCEVGYASDHASFVINQLYDKRYVEGHIVDIPFSLEMSVRLTPLGKFHLTDLLYRFEYFDAVVVDTPILLEEYRGKIHDARSPAEHRERARIFLRYIDKCTEYVLDAATKDLWSQAQNRAASQITDMDSSLFLPE